MTQLCTRRDEIEQCLNTGVEFEVVESGCNRLAHRVALGFRQALSDEMQVDHLCRNRICVRPDHLEEVTQQENIRRALPFRVTR